MGSSPAAVTLRHVKTTTLYLYLEQELLHSYEMFHKACVSLGDIFWR